MDPQNLVYFKEGRRPLAFSTAHAVSSKPIMMPNNEIAQQKPSILMGRFKALLREREDEFRASSNDDVPVPPPTTEEIVQIYALLLADLTCNLKPIITDLTIIAELQAEHARGIADAICNRILEVCLGSRGKIFTFSTVCNYIEISQNYIIIYPLVPVSAIATSNIRILGSSSSDFLFIISFSLLVFVFLTLKGECGLGKTCLSFEWLALFYFTFSPPSGLQFYCNWYYELDI